MTEKKRILFVDDEKNVLDGLRRMLRPHRKEWDMRFFSSGEEALADLAKESCDVIVSDMRMPGMNGVELLKRVQDEHPGAVRIILSGQTEEETAIQVVPIAHQFLSKPCDAERLRNIVTRSCGLQSLLSDSSLRENIADMDTLPTLPRTYAQINEVLQDPDASVAAIAKLVERDAGLCAKILQIVNSSFFGIAQRISDVSQAVNFIGIQMLKHLTLSLEVFRPDENLRKIPYFSMEEEHSHSFLTACIARELFKDKERAEEAIREKEREVEEKREVHSVQNAGEEIQISQAEQGIKSQ